MADRDGAVARAISYDANAADANGGDNFDEATCRQHRIHDVATDSVGVQLTHHIRGAVHIQRSLQYAYDCGEFRNVFRTA